MAARKSKTTADTEELRVLRRLFDILQLFREVSPDIPARYAQAFLSVAMNQGLPTGEYAKRLGYQAPVTSRILLALGIKDRAGRPGFGLVEPRTDLVDLRIKRYYLTPLGEELSARILEVVNRGK